MIRSFPSRNTPVLLIGLTMVAAFLWASAPSRASDAPPASSNIDHWVSTSDAFTADGVSEELFTSLERQQIGTWLKTPANDRATLDGVRAKSTVTREDPTACDVRIVTNAGVEQVDPRKVLESRSINLIGRVVEIETGLFHGRLASLVTVDVERWIDSGSVNRRDTVQFVYPEGRATIDGTSYCQQGNQGFRLVEGQEVFFGADRILDDDGQVFLPLTRDVFLETENHGISADGTLGAEVGQDWSAFKSRLVGVDTPWKGR